MKKKFNITGMSCASCSARVQKCVDELEGMKTAEVNLLSNTLVCDYDDKKLTTSEITSAVQKAGYGAFEAVTVEDKSNALKIRLYVSIIFLLLLMPFSMQHMLHYTLVPSYILNGVIQIILTLPIIAVNYEYFIKGFSNLIKLSPNMDSLIAIGAGASFVYSFAVLLKMIFVKSGTIEHLYFESTGMILAFITIGKYLEAISKKKTTSAIEDLIKLTPDEVTVIRYGNEMQIKTKDVKKGDTVIAKSGEYIAVDGVILSGECVVDQSSVTGESIPIDKIPGDTVISSTIIETGYIKYRADKVGEDTTISQIIKLVEEASNSKAPISRIADKISLYFVPLVIFIAIVTFFAWRISGSDLSFAFNAAVSVLVISCPCALGLATPVAIMVGTGVGTKNGILIKNAETLETAHKLKYIIFDKTGTITEGKPNVTQVISYISEYKLKQIALTMESHSEHILAKAIIEYCNGADVLKADSVKTEKGKGIRCRIEDESYYCGNQKYLYENGINPKDKFNDTVVYIANDKEVIGVFLIEDKIKSDSKNAIKALNNLGIETILATGDNQAVAEKIANEAGIKHLQAEALPHEKERMVSRYQKLGTVAMVGDGINDSPALATSDVGIAIGAGTDVAIDSADIVLINNRISDVVTAVKLSKKVVGNIKTNLFWALFYNVIGIPIAAGVFYNLNGLLLNPMISSLAMSLSSVFVVTNALRLQRFKK